ncbi:hypothetical protein TWF102_001140 [Orbilia oligospora]|uniref:Glutamine amidotransferase type-2 domain-containing protein n=1 Tax=Orbilia oligospora TaxID=2813651 RepID=A0A7C8NHM6_ORBOL|nr:hypothetical protein TWF102_001140 [Orbilia oligospora]KAF3095362.1 hypothetical protein TWF103_010330 [Orbilia oligospora]
MCGILFELSQADNSTTSSTSDDLVKDVTRRGPDSLESVELVVGSLRLKFTSSVLSLRGTAVVPQPIFSKSNRTEKQDDAPEYVLCWNGEAWRLNGQEFGSDENDAQVIFAQLSSCSGKVQDVLQKIEGPFAFVFYDGSSKRVWFGRDWLGRRSLLRRKSVDDDGNFAICSIADPQATSQWEEIEADGFYYIDLQTYTSPWHPHRFAFVSDSELSTGPLSMRLPIPQLCKHIPPTNPPALNPQSSPVMRLYDLLYDSLRLRVQNVPRHSIPLVPGHEGILRPSKVGILFSGGVDCTMLARVVHDILPTEEPIELLNVAFENRRVLQAAFAEAKKARKSKNASTQVNGETGLGPSASEDVSVTGSIDSVYDICPDRQTGRKSWLELQSVCSTRDWRFREINVPYEEVIKHKSAVIALLHPHDTEMDLSIGLAFYFASRPLETDSPRILLSGLGADELFGGYARHGTAFNRAGYPGLIDELELDLTRLGKRNLGRDDRIIANWGREARFPFLDERLLQEVISWPVTEKCGFGAVQSGEEWSTLDNEKQVLRLLAWKLGMKGVAGEKKRAIQFGARTAKMEAARGGKVKGTQKISAVPG